ncbi:MAG: hypothetical protein PHI36_10090 [Bacteroidales bacterium]|nr:hypothetical protein [Bacteroidales bacterium]
MMMNKKTGDCNTSGIFYCRESAEIDGCESHQILSVFESDLLRNRQQKHAAIC